jgi:peptidoglycan/LPS O-acetylase OafA/YrhL
VGLDGLRALAVLAVIAFHEGFRAAPGGFLGVDVFFVLSGYLITDLLAAQFGRSGDLHLRDFWVRRARRLLPALGAVLVTVTAVTAVAEPDQLGSLRSALISAVTYTSNWWQALHRQSYFTVFGPPPPLQHLWSLAVEEQFYLIWPLVLAVVLARVQRQPLRAAVAWAGAAASAVAMAVLYVPGSDPSLVYYGTDTHATALLAGAAIALTWPMARLATLPRRVAGRLDLLGVAGLITLAWAVAHFSGADPAVYPAGLTLAALAAGAVVIAATAPGRLARALGWGPLRWLGIRSYGIYLWHWPVIAFCTAQDPRWAVSLAGRGAETGAALVLAAASWRWLEEPVLRQGLRPALRAGTGWVTGSPRTARRSPIALVTLAIPVLMLAVACTAGYGILHRQSGPTLQQQISHGAQVSAASRAHQNPRPSPAVSGATAPAVLIGPPSSSRSPGQRPARMHKISGNGITAVGDSVMLASAPQLRAALPGIYIDAAVSRQLSTGVQVVRSLADSGQLRPVVLVGLGTNGAVTSAELQQLRAAIGPKRRLVLVNTYEARPWEAEVNAELATAARRDPRVALANWHDAIEHHTGLLWDDEVHPRPAGAVLYARAVKAAIRATQSGEGSGTTGTTGPGAPGGPGRPDGPGGERRAG